MSTVLKKLLDSFEKAVAEKAWIGSKAPEERPAIIRDYLEAKADLLDFLKQEGGSKKNMKAWILERRRLHDELHGNNPRV